MNNKSLDSVGTLTTFYDTFNDSQDGFDEVIIPKIQRDYAQGRTCNVTLRKRFLSALFDAVDFPSPHTIELDFIYGQRSSVGRRVFYPIDGQQRLTTLFLLHLYVAKRAGIYVQEATFLSKFSYQTRDSSKKFCERLLQTDADKFIGIANNIRDQWWFTSVETSDPTISGMLNTLDDIDEHYKNLSTEGLAQIWERLKTNITFWRLYLDDLDTTDDLYIKMNSRGKPLTDFEHFKAEIESYNKKNGQFSLKMDTVWTDILWKYRKATNDSDPENYMKNSLDERFINLFYNFMLIEGTKHELDFSRIKDLSALALAEKVIKPNPQLLDRFSKIMDFFHELPDIGGWFSEIISTECYESGECGEKIYFDNLPTPDILEHATSARRVTLAQLLIIETFFEYASSDTPCDIHEITRVLRNVILNSRDEIRDTKMRDLFLAVDAIVKAGCMTADIAASKNDFRIRQKELELKKQEWMANNRAEAYLLKEIENHSLIRGNAELFFDRSNFDVQDMRDFLKIFQYSGNSYIVEFLDTIERALLLYGDYAPEVKSRWLYGGRNWVNWRDEVFANVNNQPALREQLHKMLSAFSTCNSLPEFEHIINETLDDMAAREEYTWAYYMARHKGMRHTDSARYAPLENSDNCKYNRQMMNKSQYNGRNWNPYLFCIHMKLGMPVTELGDYDEQLKLPSLNCMVKAIEHSFIITHADGSVEAKAIPVNSKQIDAVDRIEWFTGILKEMLASAKDDVLAD